MGSVKVDSKRQHTGWEDILHHPVYCVFLTGWEYEDLLEQSGIPINKKIFAENVSIKHCFQGLPLVNGVPNSSERSFRPAHLCTGQG